jgi:hemolysin III
LTNQQTGLSTTTTQSPSMAQSLAEEIANAVTHGIGAALSIVGLTLMVVIAVLYGDGWQVMGMVIYGGSLVFLYLASTLYHSFQIDSVKQFFHRMDHVGISMLIAGTYTPILLVKMRNPQGLTFLVVIWTLAITAAVIKSFFTGRFVRLSTAIYVAMGWLALLLAKPMIDTMGWDGALWLLAGGLAYSLGVIPFLWERLRFHHAIWHLFVMAGSVFHFFGIFRYVLLPIH